LQLLSCGQAAVHLVLPMPRAGGAQDVSGGAPVAVEGTDLPLWGMEVDPEAAKEEFRASMAKDSGAGAKVRAARQPIRITQLHGPHCPCSRASC
jgi:hypothetical protein